MRKVENRIFLQKKVQFCKSYYVNFSAWYGSEPNNGPTYNYAIMYYSYDFQWVDTHDAAKYYPICFHP